MTGSATPTAPVTCSHTRPVTNSSTSGSVDARSEISPERHHREQRGTNRSRRPQVISGGRKVPRLLQLQLILSLSPHTRTHAHRVSLPPIASPSNALLLSSSRSLCSWPQRHLALFCDFRLFVKLLVCSHLIFPIIVHLCPLLLSDLRSLSGTSWVSISPVGNEEFTVSPGGVTPPTLCVPCSLVSMPVHLKRQSRLQTLRATYRGR